MASKAPFCLLIYTTSVCVRARESEREGERERKKEIWWEEEKREMQK